jgi:hypothetical protein
MTAREAAIVTIYTGYLIGDFGKSIAYYIKLARSIKSEGLTGDALTKRVKELAGNDFCKIKVGRRLNDLHI